MVFFEGRGNNPMKPVKGSHVLMQLMKVSMALCVLVMLSMLYGCQGSIASQVIANSYPTAPRNYKTAGFANANEIDDYTKHYQYLAFKISSEDWSAFYSRFPEYWSDIQKSKSYTFMNDYNAGYTAYAFRWNLMNKRNKWDQTTIERLETKQIIKEDDIYKIVFAVGMPQRILWDNDFDILMYSNGNAILLDNNKYKYSVECKECIKKIEYIDGINKKNEGSEDEYTKSLDSILKTLSLTRPEY